MATGLVGALVVVIAGGFGLRRGAPGAPPPAPMVGQGVLPVSAGAAPGASIAVQIDALQARLERLPGDQVAWATLGIAYVQQARIVADPTLYARADGALDRSFAIDDSENFLAYAGRSALASARHEFAAAKTFAQQGLAVNDYSALLHGALADAETQLGEYDAAADDVQRMVDLSPDTTSFARVSYIFELRGDDAQAVMLMERALEAAPSDDDRAFAQYFLGELAFDQGDAVAALEHYSIALESTPRSHAARAGRAKALAANGRVDDALAGYAEVVADVPDPNYLIAYGELLESIGRVPEAQEQYRVATAALGLYAANGVQPDAEEVLFLADHGDPAAALTLAETAITTRPFLAVHDAYAWALYRNGRYDEALAESRRALALGTRSARYHFHAGMILQALGDDAAATTELTTAMSINPAFDPLDAPAAIAALAELGS